MVTKPLVPEGYADHLSGNWDEVPEWAIRRINFLEEQLKWNDEQRCPKMHETCPKIPEHSCHTVKHCYPYLCDGSCGHNEIWVSDEEKEFVGDLEEIVTFCDQEQIECSPAKHLNDVSYYSGICCEAQYVKEKIAEIRNRKNK